MYITIIRERDFTLGHCDATGEVLSFFIHTSSEPLHRNCYPSLYMYRESLMVHIQQWITIPVEWLRQCVLKKDGISPVALQPPSVKSLSLMMVVYMQPKHVGVKVVS
jgi:hypothetical protein